MKKKILSITGLALSAMLVLGACGSSDSSKYDSPATEMYTNGSASYDYYDDYGYEDEYYEGDYDSFGSSSKAESVTESGAESKADSSRKLIKTVDIDVETKEFDNLVATLEQQVTSFDGYVEYSYTNNGSKYGSYVTSRSADYTIRIPKENLKAFLDSFSALCNVVNKNERVEDITLTYVDLESHKSALKAEQERLLQLLDEAYDLNDILVIESRLTDIRYQLESMESQLRTYDNKVNYSTVTLSISEVKELTIVEPEPETFWERVSSGFVESLSGVGEGLKNFIIGFIIALPYLLLWGGIIFGIVMIIRAIVRFNVKKNRIRREKEEAERIKKAQMAPVAPSPYVQIQGTPIMPGQQIPPVPMQNVAPSPAAEQAKQVQQ